MANIKLPKTASGIEKLALSTYRQKNLKDRVKKATTALVNEQKPVKAKAPSTGSYREGNPTDKVWDNYQLTKEMKTAFKDLCALRGIKASVFLRSCIKIFIEKEGNLKSSGTEIKKKFK